MTSQDNGDKAPPKKIVSSDDLYRRSSQFKFWSYTETTLIQIRQECNEVGKRSSCQKFDDAYAKIKTENGDVFKEYPQELSRENLLDPLTLEEELQYLNYFAKNIVEAANFFKMPTQVKATAISFFKKFYLFNSVVEFHPKNILYTCLFLAAKSENYFISIESFCKALQKTEPKDVLDLEFTVLLALKFTLLVHHPFRPLYGFFLDFQAVLLHPSPALSDVNVDKLGELYDAAKRWLNEFAMLSDVTFLFTPPQIALAAMYDCNRRVTEKYLKKKFLKKESLDTITENEETNEIERTDKDKEAHKESDSETAKVIDTEKEHLSSDRVSGSTKKKNEFEILLTTIRRCIKMSKQIQNSTKEESSKIERKRFFAVNPEKLINKRIKKLKNAKLTTETNGQETSKAPES